MRCLDCKYFETNFLESDYDGKCTHERNWRPSRGDMPCDLDFKCSYFEPREG